MPVTQAELARRLRAARENSGLTQQAVADELQLPRTAIVQMEGGQRAVSSLELDRLARLFGRGLSEFVNDEAFLEDPLLALFRGTAGVAEDPALAGRLRVCANLCREATHIEQLLGHPPAQALAVSYSGEAGSSRWDAICQGRAIAEQERNRLGLGISPAWEIAEIIRSQGVRVTEDHMPMDVSGLFLYSRDIGAVIVVNHDHPRARRLFSYAHEYCHVLADRLRVGTVSRTQNRDELIEIRANAFAANFLLPEQGVRAFLQGLGKGEPSRQVHEVFDGGAPEDATRPEGVLAQRRAAPGSQAIQVHDVVGLAHHFGVSYDAAVFHLLNLRLIPKDRFDELRSQQGLATEIKKALRIAEWDERVHWTLADQVLALAFEAYRRNEISKSKFFELADAVKVPRDELRNALEAVDPRLLGVDAHTPE